MLFALDSEELTDCLRSLIHEQQQLCGEASGTTLSSVRLMQRLVVLERYFTGLSRHKPQQARSPARKKQHSQANLDKQKRYGMFSLFAIFLLARQLELNYKFVVSGICNSTIFHPNQWLRTNGIDCIC